MHMLRAKRNPGIVLDPWFVQIIDWPRNPGIAIARAQRRLDTYVTDAITRVCSTKSPMVCKYNCSILMRHQARAQ